MKCKQVGNYWVTIDGDNVHVCNRQHIKSWREGCSYIGVITWGNVNKKVEKAVKLALERTLREQNVRNAEEIAAEYLDILMEI